jgi:antitoxin component of RelBE/YafQ-DinJ toxin-antitoxin module
MKTEQSKKTEFIGFRLTVQEREAIEILSSGLGLTISDFLRDFTTRIIQQILNAKHNG